jgi:hypothetical protein
LQELLNENKDICVSIYLPTHPVGREQQQDPVRFKNLLTETRGQLEARGMRKPEAEAFLKPADELLSDSHFWQHQSNGLAVFISTDIFETYRLPIEFEPLLVIADNFHLKPILPFVSGNGHFYILALSQNEIRLLQANRYHISEVDLGNTPTSLREALWFDDPEKQLQFHTGTAAPGSTNTRPSIFHGQGATEDDNKTELLRYFQKVDRGMMDFLHHEQAPLVLAGVDYLLPIYHEANSYSYLVEDAITGNPEERNNAELHQAAWKVVRPIFKQDLHEALARYQELSGAGSDLASSHLSEIVKACHHGQVDILFTALGVQVWGSFDENEVTVEQHQRFQPGDQDLLDLAAVQTLLNGGKVYVLKPEEMPEPQATIAAIYRFSY